MVVSNRFGLEAKSPRPQGEMPLIPKLDDKGKLKALGAAVLLGGGLMLLWPYLPWNHDQTMHPDKTPTKPEVSRFTPTTTAGSVQIESFDECMQRAQNLLNEAELKQNPALKQLGAEAALACTTVERVSPAATMPVSTNG